MGYDSVMTPPSARRSHQERVTESTQRLLSAAVELIAENGLQHTTGVEIGQRAGYSKEMVRARYGSKEGLIKELLETEYEPLLLRAPDDEHTGLQQLRDQIDLIRSEVARNPQLMRAFFVLCFEAVGTLTSIRPWMIDWSSRYQGQLAAALRRGQQDGSVNADLDPDAEAAAIMGLALGRAYYWTLDPDSVDLVTEVTAWCDQLEARYGNPHRHNCAQ